jgi:tetratricopeptide (TPR) repeat protein
MKSDRRHELQHNQLADAVEQWIEKARPYSRLLVGLVVLLAAVAVTFSYVSGKGKERISAGWDEYFEAVNGGDRVRLGEIAEKYAGTPVAPWARVVSADLALAEGCAKLFNEKAEARELLQHAVDNYQSVLSDDSDSALKQRALFGLGRAHEALGSLENLTKAREDYQKLITDFPDGIYTVAAKNRLADLDRTSTKQFYDWFAKYEPPRAKSALGKKPEFLEQSLDSTDLKLPSAVDDFDPTKPRKEGDAPAEGSDDLVLPDEPAETAPETPAESAPEKPAAEKPE